MMRHLCRDRLRRAALWLGALALVFQAWLPLVHHPATLFAPDGAETAAFDRLFGETPPLCTIAAHAEGTQPGEAPQHCPICKTLHMVANFAPPIMAPLAASPAFLLDGYRLPRGAPCVARAILAPQPRAPPLAI